ncbi:MAG: ComF family protein [Chitinophagales bacterium]
MNTTSLPAFSDLLNLFFPDNCRACGHRLLNGEEIVCLHCCDQLPETDFHLHEPNMMSKLFWGRIDIQYCLAAYFFFKKSSIQKLMHQLKYHGKTEVGSFVGKNYGLKLKHVDFHKAFDLIIPVPLHKRKQKIRGYNQSDFFAAGLSEALGIPWSGEVMKRNIFSQSQTKKSKYQRWDNVSKIFSVEKTDKVKGKHILLVDDVVTTGSTLEACALQLHRAEAAKVSLAVIGYAHS